ncbi:MAG: polysaccharide pyruvyl transferase family protein [Myxococcales bacterium]
MTIRERVKELLDPDRLLLRTMDTLIEVNGIRHALELGRESWRPGKPLKLLLAGYTGSRNTGSDIRPEEMIRQFRTIWGDDQLELSILTMDRKLTAGYFRTARQIELPLVYPGFLAREVPKHHGVIGVEGSMFKSKFSNAVTTMMASAMGLAAAERKLSVGYGAEAGSMDEPLRDFVSAQCRNSLVICRNEPSRRVLSELGVRTLTGTDTAWTFRPAPAARGAQLLRAAGWDGRQKVLAVGPINPFWWPVKPDLVKAFEKTIEGRARDDHYRSIYFHEWGAEARRKYQRYIDGFTSFLERWLARSDVFPILFGMEQLDRKACEDIARQLSRPVPLFVSDEHNMYDLVSVLHHCALLVSSRFHALVTSMLAAVPSAGVTMDERITNLMSDRGHADLMLGVEDDQLGDRLHETMVRLEARTAEVAKDIERFVPTHLKMLGQMGIDLEDEVARVYPEFPRVARVRSWEQYLPTPAPSVQKMLENHA